MGLSHPRFDCPEQYLSRASRMRSQQDRREIQPRGAWRKDHPCKSLTWGFKDGPIQTTFLRNIFFFNENHCRDQAAEWGLQTTSCPMCYGKGGGGGDESLDRANRLLMKSWPRKSRKNKLRQWEGRGSEEVGASSQASQGFAQQALFQTRLKLRSCFNTQQKAPKSICTFSSTPNKSSHSANVKGRKKERGQ